MKTLLTLIALIIGAIFGTLHPLPLPPSFAQLTKPAATPPPNSPAPHQATPAPRGAWMYDPERKTALDAPARKVGGSALDRPAYK